MSVVNDKKSLQSLPNEIYWIISDYLSFHDIQSLSQVSKKLHVVFISILNYYLEDIPWSITIDFSRDKNHHIVMHNSWAKIGWFPDLRQKDQKYHDIIEYCPICFTQQNRNYVVTHRGIGRPGADLVLKCRRNSYVVYTKAYCPMIVDITTDPCSIETYGKYPIIFIEGNRRQIKERPEIIPGLLRSEQYEYSSHIMYKVIV